MQAIKNKFKNNNCKISIQSNISDIDRKGIILIGVIKTSRSWPMKDSLVAIAVMLSIMVCSCSNPSIKPEYATFRKSRPNLVISNPKLPRNTYEEEHLMQKQNPKSLPKCIELVTKLPSSATGITFLGNYIVYQETKPKNTIVCYDYQAKREVWRLENRFWESMNFSETPINNKYIIVDHYGYPRTLVQLKTGKELASFSTMSKIEILSDKYLLYMDNPRSFEDTVKLHCQKLGTFKDLWTKDMFHSNHFVGFSVISSYNNMALIAASASTPSDGCVSISASSMFVCDLETGKTIKSLPYRVGAAGFMAKSNPIHEDVGNGLSLLTTEDASNSKRSLYLFDLKSMKTLWSFNDPQVNHTILVNNKVFYAKNDNTLFKFDTNNGKLIWSHIFGKNISSLDMGLIGGKCHFLCAETIKPMSYSNNGISTEHLMVFDDNTGKVLSNEILSWVKGEQKQTRITLPFDGFEIVADWKTHLSSNSFTPDRDRGCNVAFLVNGKPAVKTTRECFDDVLLHDGLLITASVYGVTAYDLRGNVRWSSDYGTSNLTLVDDMLALVTYNRWIFLNPENGKFISWFWMVNTTTVTSEKIRLTAMLDWIGKKPGGITLPKLKDDMYLLQNHNKYNFAYSRGEDNVEIYRLPKLD